MSIKGFGQQAGVPVSASTVTVTTGAGLLLTNNTPASATATGVAGTLCADANFIYYCVATNTWKRVAISTW